MIKFTLVVLVAVLKAMGWLIGELIRIFVSVLQPPQFAPGLGAYGTQQTKTSKVLPAVRLPKVAVAEVEATKATPERDPLVLRTPQEMVTDQDMLKGREAPSVSSRVVTIPLEADGGLPIGTAWVYLFERDAAGKELHFAKRVVKFSNRSLARLICGPNESRFFFKDVPYDPEKGTRQITSDFIAEIGILLNKKQAVVKAPMPQVSSKSPPVVKQQVQDKAQKPAPARPAASPMPAPGPVAKAGAEGPPPPVKRAVKGTVYEGIVVSAGNTTKTGAEGSYQTFCLTINDGQLEVPLHGTEIRRLVTDMGIREGERIRVVDMGKKEIPSGDGGKPWSKNLYQITRLGAH